MPFFQGYTTLFLQIFNIKWNGRPALNRIEFTWITPRLFGSLNDHLGLVHERSLVFQHSHFQNTAKAISLVHLCTYCNPEGIQSIMKPPSVSTRVTLALVACPNTPTLPNHDHPLNSHEIKFLFLKYCYREVRAV